MSFDVIPAIDLLGGKVVRLHQGDYASATVYSDDPVGMAHDFRARGVRRLHVVDLDGARDGAPTQHALIAEMARVDGLELEVGGGIRSLSTLTSYLDTAGAQWAILGTVAHTDPDLVREACQRWPGRIIVGLDARGGRVAVNGWLEATSVTPTELGLAFADAGVAAIIYTDISRDGTGHGPNVESTAALARDTGIPVIASGGVANMAHIRGLAACAEQGVVGVVVGRAILSGALPLETALGAL